MLQKKNDEKSNWLTILAVFFVQKSWHTALQYDLRGEKHPLSSGCERWVVFGGSVNKMIFSSAASLITSGL